MSRSSSCVRAFPRDSRVAGGVIGLRTRDVIIAIVAHSRRHRSKSFVLSASISFRSSSRAACDIRSLSLSRSFGQERDHLYQKGIRPRRQRSLSKVSKRLSRGVVASPPHPKRYRPISRVFARLRHRAVFSLLRATFWIESNPNPIRIRIRIERACASVVRAPKTVKTTTPFLRFKANKNPLSNNNVFLPVTDACCVIAERKREKDMSGQIV